ncbi:hypothetical protein D3C72_2355630 [compost metagenome]
MMSTSVPSVFIPGALGMAGALGFSTGLVGPVLEPIAPASATEDNNAVRARAVSLDRLMVSSPTKRVLSD